MRVSRSGHWTRLSSAQQEAMNPVTRPRWRSTGSSLGLRRSSEACAFACCSRSWRLCSRRVSDFSFGSSSWAACRRRRGRAPAPAGVLALGAEGVDVGALLGELGLDDVGRLGHLRVVLGARLLGAFLAGQSRLARLALLALGLALCS